MKKTILLLLSIAVFVLPVFSQRTIHTVGEFSVHDEENRFYLQMPAREVYDLLGNPLEVRRVRHPSPVHEFDRVIIKYQGITFIYADLFDDPQILVIGFSENYQMNNMKLIGLNKNQVIEKYGTPGSIEKINRYTYFRYRFNLDQHGLEHFILQFRFNSWGICVGVMLIHGFFNI